MRWQDGSIRIVYGLVEKGKHVVSEAHQAGSPPAQGENRIAASSEYRDIGLRFGCLTGRNIVSHAVSQGLLMHVKVRDVPFLVTLTSKGGNEL